MPSRPLLSSSRSRFSPAPPARLSFSVGPVCLTWRTLLRSRKSASLLLIPRPSLSRSRSRSRSPILSSVPAATPLPSPADHFVPPMRRPISSWPRPWSAATSPLLSLRARQPQQQTLPLPPPLTSSSQPRPRPSSRPPRCPPLSPLRCRRRLWGRLPSALV